MNIFYIIVAVVLVSFYIIVKEIRKEEKAVKEAKQIEGMSVHKFACKVAKLEGKKKQVNVAQIKEILKVVNELLNGELYTLIKNDKKTNKNNKCCGHS